MTSLMRIDGRWFKSSLRNHVIKPFEAIQTAFSYVQKYGFARCLCAIVKNKGKKL